MKKLLMFLLFALWVVPASADVVVCIGWMGLYDNGWHFAEGRAIAVDTSGNVYVTGYRGGYETCEDYATMKYYPNGDTAWVRTYNGPGNSRDCAYGIAVDDSGNVYVTGDIDFYSGHGDYATIKYYPNGDTAWVRIYNGPGNGDDRAAAIAVDGSGCVYVTGESWGSGTGYDYATIKYYPNGDTAWVRRYNFYGNGGDCARAVAVDSSGNVYITGRSQGNSGDYATIKYYPNGDTAWVRRYVGGAGGGACAITVDDNGNIYLTGSSAQSSENVDYVTIKYYPNGDTAWIRRYDGPGNYDDQPYAIAVDEYGNVYVTGSSAQSSEIPNNLDYATIKYYPNGDTAWVRRYDGPGHHHDVASALAIDSLGNVYVTGYNSSGDWATLKYYPNGYTAWLAIYNGEGNDFDWAHAIAVDNSGNAYVTGSSPGSSGTAYYHYTTIKYVESEASRGDANGDSVITVTDVVYLINFLFIGGPLPIPCLEAGDVNCDGMVNSADVVYLINYLFIDGPPPCEP